MFAHFFVSLEVAFRWTVPLRGTVHPFMQTTAEKREIDTAKKAFLVAESRILRAFLRGTGGQQCRSAGKSVERAALSLYTGPRRLLVPLSAVIVDDEQL